MNNQSNSGDGSSSLSMSEGVESGPSINPGYRDRRGSGENRLEAGEYLEGIRRGDRTLLSRAITLVESRRPEDRELGQEIVEACLPYSGESVRVGITGVPGVGKSTFIEALGNHILEKGRRLAVLAIDPSSTRTKGSILGDKTRMPSLANHSSAYIRPSPTGGSLGGVARKTRESIFLCEAGGYDTVFIETVGVGQSETSVHSMVDFFLLLMLAGAGDELQGIKRGIMEMADMLAINKTDSAPAESVNRSLREYKNALHLYPEPESGWPPKVTTCSALEGSGIPEIWEAVEDYLRTTRENGWFERKRNRQARHWMDETIRSRLMDDFHEHPAVKERYEEIRKAVLEGELSSFRAAALLLDRYRGEGDG